MNLRSGRRGFFSLVLMCSPFQNAFASAAAKKGDRLETKTSTESIKIQLTEHHLGSLDLNDFAKPAREEDIQKKLKAAFPSYLVLHEKSGDCDSCDSDTFEVQSRNDKKTLFVASYNESGSQGKPSRLVRTLKLNALSIVDSKIIDKFGIHVGSSVEEIKAKRPNGLKINSDLHHDVAVGDGVIWYRFQCNPEGEPHCTLDSLAKVKRQVIALEWPYPGW